MNINEIGAMTVEGFLTMLIQNGSESLKLVLKDKDEKPAIVLFMAIDETAQKVVPILEDFEDAGGEHVTVSTPIDYSYDDRQGDDPDNVGY